MISLMDNQPCRQVTPIITGEENYISSLIRTILFLQAHSRLINVSTMTVIFPVGVLIIVQQLISLSDYYKALGAICGQLSPKWL